MRKVLIDTNLLVLLTVGVYNTDLIGDHKRCKAFSIDDFTRLQEFLGNYQELWITSHCLAEASNLLKQARSYKTAEALLKTLHALLAPARESHIAKHEVFASPHYLKLGVADTAILQKSKSVHAVLTVDVDLYDALRSNGVNAVNLNHYRAY